MSSDNPSPLIAFEAQHPKAISDMKADAFAEGHNEGHATGKSEGDEAAVSRATLYAETFADDPAFAFSQFAAGRSMAEAKAAYVEILQTKNEKMKAELEQRRIDDGKPSASFSGPGSSRKATTLEGASDADMKRFRKEYDEQDQWVRDAVTFEDYVKSETGK